MCQLENGALFKMKREKVKEFEVLFRKIRTFRDSRAIIQTSLITDVKNSVKLNIISAVGRDDLQLAKLIYRRAVIAGLPL